MRSAKSAIEDTLNAHRDLLNNNGFGGLVNEAQSLTSQMASEISKAEANL
jgi:hypothetical protein